MLNASLPKIAPRWAIPKPLAPAAVASNARLVTNGLASNPSRNFATNTALLSPAPAPIKPAAPAKPVTANTISVNVLLATTGMPPPEPAFQTFNL